MSSPTPPLLSREAKVGLFLLGTVLVIFWATFQLGNLRVSLERGDRYQVRVRNAHGLGPDTAVELSGIRVGRVLDVDLAPDGRARLTLLIRRGVEVYRNAAVEIRTSGLLGDRYLELRPGDPQTGRLPEGAEIPTAKEPLSIEEIFDQLTPVIQNLEAVTADLRRLLGTTEFHEDVWTTARVLRRTAERAERLLAGIDAEARRLLTNLARASDELPAGIQEFRGLVRRADAGFATVTDTTVAVAARAQRLLDDLGAAAEEVRAVVRRVQAGEGALGKLLVDPSTGAQVDRIVGGLEETLDRIERLRTIVDYVGMLEGGGGLAEPGMLHRAELRLQPRYDTYYAFGFVSRPEGRTLLQEHRVERLDASGAVLATTRSVETVVDDRFLFSLTLAKRFWDVTLRGGMIENTGGIGLDYALWDDRIWLRTEAFDFLRRDDLPHVRAWGELRLFGHLTLAAGVDDLVGRRLGRRWMVGAGIHFDDEDLKLLLWSLPSLSIQ